LDERESTDCLFGSADAMRLSGTFDLVIANPPYVRTQVLGAEKSKRLAQDFQLTGRVDLYHAFAVAMTTTLRPGGVLALLCSNRFLTTKTGLDLRKMLADNYRIVNVFDLGDTKAFSAAVLPAVVIAQRDLSGSTTTAMMSIYESRDGIDASAKADSVFSSLTKGQEGPVSVDGTVFDVRRGVVDISDPRKPWVPASEQGDSWLAKIEASAVMRFGDIGKLRVGIKTTADTVFIRDDWDAQEAPPELELLHPLITHHIARRWTADVPVKRVLYPYDLSSFQRRPLDLREYPATTAYLESHRTRLEGRQYVVDGGRRWWEIWVPQRPSAWAGPKIVCPDISETPKFLYDTSGAIVNGDCYWVAVPDESLAMLMLAVANSDLGMAYYDAVCGNKLYAGRRRYITQYVERFPIPDPSLSVARDLVDVARLLISGKLSEKRQLELEAKVNRLESFGVEEFSG